MSGFAVTPVPELLDELRRGHRILMLDEREGRANEGVVMLAAEHCTPEHITFLARRARGLVCLAMPRERCDQLGLPPMAGGDSEDGARFTLSIEAAEGIDTGISAADRAHTVRVAASPRAAPEDIVQPGHIFPLAGEPGGVLTRAGHTEAAVDLTRLAGLVPAAVIADVLDAAGDLADGPALAAFAAEHGLKIGTVADLIHYRMSNERTVERVREGEIDTRHGRFRLAAYRDRSHGGLHLALFRGALCASAATLVRVHVATTLRDLLGAEESASTGWSAQAALARIAEEGVGALVLLARRETDEQVLEGLDRILKPAPAPESRSKSNDSYNTVGAGSQILRDLGIGKIRLLGTPIKYNAISGFGLELIEYIEPEAVTSVANPKGVDEAP
ncbi:MAG: 3,4-dihydroxy-2-butanone-4-phosphate synthase [Halieaceae bacterium]|jgi:3,4-dihydroxy 2-butanone 4-phosphate synthase/GTP cyclohydrolase II|nr:3,4-dihydroxy-2-butanone-4-phosphate synthase [Halieaceae bacterium]